MFRTPPSRKSILIPPHTPKKSEYKLRMIELVNEKFLVSHRVKKILEKADKEIADIYEQHLAEKERELEELYDEEEKRLAMLKY